MKRSDAYPSKYVSKDDLTRPVSVTIQTVVIETLEGDDKKEDKPIMYFNEEFKPFIVNSTNWNTIEEAYGLDSDEWVDHKIVLYHDPNVMFGKKKVGGVRVRIPGAKAKPLTVRPDGVDTDETEEV